MTAQFNDIVTYRGREFAISGIDGEGLFEPQSQGLEPVATCTACWRGYICEYTVVNDEIRLDTLRIGFDKKNSLKPPELFGVSPIKDDFLAFKYTNLNQKIPFDGGLLIADGFISGLYVHMGFHPAWKYREVHELVFIDGKLLSEEDCSEKLKQLRENMKDPKNGWVQDESQSLQDWVKQCFQRDYPW